MSFDHLKGNDLTMARSLSTCPGIDAHLVLVTPTVSGERGLSGGLKRRRCDNGSTGATCVPHTTTEVGLAGCFLHTQFLNHSNASKSQ